MTAVADDLDLDALRRTELFAGVGEGGLRAARALMTRGRSEPGSVLFAEGGAAERLHLINAGRLRLSQSGSDGQQVIFRYLKPGELAGYAAVADASTHPWTATAADQVHHVSWGAPAMRQLMLDHPRIAMNIVTVLAARYTEMQVHLREIATEKVERRIAHAVLRLVRQAGRRTAEGVEIVIPMSRQDLAEMSGTTLHTVSRQISQWEQKGIVASGRCRIVIRNPHALAMIAEPR